jgi:hypothetical protein
VDIASAMLFMLTLVAEVVISIYVLIYAMHDLTTVVQETAAGNDEVNWPSEPFLDWLFGSLHLVVLVLVLLAPAGILTRASKDSLFPGDDVLRFLVLAVPGLWLLFPVALLSSLSGEQRWMVLRPAVLGRMLRAAPATLAVYVASAVLAAGAAALWYMSLKWGGRWWLLMPAAAAVSAAAFLVYARLLGRLGWVIGRFLPAKRKREAAAKTEKPTTPAAKAQDPWAAPDAPPAPEKPPGEEPKPATTVAPDGEPYESYGLGDEPVKPPTYEEIAPKKPTRIVLPKRDRAAKTIPWPMVRGVYTFPFRGANIKALLWLTLGALVWAVGALILIGLLQRVTGG